MSLTVCYTLGQGEYAPMGLLLSRSITEFSPNCEQIIYLPADEAEDIPDAIRTECESHGELVVAPPPKTEYRIARKLKAFRIAAERSDTDCTVLLDTDTLVLDTLSRAPFGANELNVRPANFASRRWETGMEETLSEDLFGECGFEFPMQTVCGTVDGKQMPACWNAGVVSTTNSRFPAEWLDLSIDLYERIQHKRFADQVALAMLATEMDTGRLPIKDNFPASFRLQIPSDLRVLHYYEFYHLVRVPSLRLRSKFRKIGLWEILRQYTHNSNYSSVIKYIGTNVFHRLVGW